MKKSINEVLKQKEFDEQIKRDKNADENDSALDSLDRVKVLSPGRLVFNRFIRNKLAIIGTVILVIMFAFSFVCPLFYPYSQTETFYKYDKATIDYATASERSEYNLLMLDAAQTLPVAVRTRLNTMISGMESSGASETSVDSDGDAYVLTKLADNIYGVLTDARIEVCSIGGFSDYATYNSLFDEFNLVGAGEVDEGLISLVQSAIDGGKEEFEYQGDAYKLAAGRKNTYTIEKQEGGVSYTAASLGSSFEEALEANLEAGSFEYNGKSYTISETNGGYVVYESGDQETVAYLTTYVFDAYRDSSIITDEFRVAALAAITEGGEFEADGASYSVEEAEDELMVYDGSGAPVAELSTLVIRSYSGEDNLDIAYKDKVREVIEEMQVAGKYSATFEWEIPQLNSEGQYTYDENGELVKDLTTLTITNKNFSYVITCEQVTYLIDIYAAGSSEHWMGTDGNGMDVLARMMYGGRVSLMVCFVVIIIENIIGIILGGIAGFFGGWIDNVIMRLVDIVYCIPSIPILIIIGSVLDAMKADSYVRLMWMMIILGILGWASVARLVRGQILSLREQEFMVAAEAIGLNTKRRIFKHLVPNVMPQLIVTASNALGGIILTESTLSFLGLGVKHPLATWGTMINSVTGSTENMIKYTYIWIPVGALICLTVIAFNFVGDGLRDAFDPKMKR